MSQITTEGQPDILPEKGSITESPNNWSIKDAYRTQIPKDEDHWEACFQKVQKLDDEMCQGWRDEIDTMLIFAGLFSATVTAFVVESYQWLQESPSQTLARFQLQRILESSPSLQPDNASPTNATSAACINALWFSSLTLALGAALVGILCKQWLREYLRYENLEGKKSLPIREMRYKGLQGWHVPGIISFLPLLLQTALVLFFIGILILLWSLQRVVAAIVTVIVGTIFTFLIATSLLPVIQWRSKRSFFKTQCAFKSPQSWAFILATWFGSPESTWTQYDSSMVNWSGTAYLLSSLNRLYNSFSQNVTVVRNIYHCIAEPGSSVEASEFAATFSDYIRWAVHPIPSPKDGATSAEIDIKKIRDDIALGFFSAKLAVKDLNMFYRHAEHCTRLLDSTELIRDPAFSASILRLLSDCVKSASDLSSPLEWDFAVASQLISVFSSMFANDCVPDDALLHFWSEIFPSLLAYGSRHRDIRLSPYALFDEIGPWLLRYPKNGLKIFRVEECVHGMLVMVVTGAIDHMSPDELGGVKLLLPVIDELYLDDPDSYSSISRDFDILHRYLNLPRTHRPRPPLYNVSNPESH